MPKNVKQNETNKTEVMPTWNATLRYPWMPTTTGSRLGCLVVGSGDFFYGFCVFFFEVFVLFRPGKIKSIREKKTHELHRNRTKPETKQLDTPVPPQQVPKRALKMSSEWDPPQRQYPHYSPVLRYIKQRDTFSQLDGHNNTWHARHASQIRANISRSMLARNTKLHPARPGRVERRQQFRHWTGDEIYSRVFVSSISNVIRPLSN